MYSYTLAAGQALERPPLRLFTASGSETVATYGDATKITASGFGSTLSRFDNWYRPANAFDGDPDTSWRVGGVGDPVGQSVRVDLAAQRTVSQVTFSVAPSVRRIVSEVVTSFSDGSSVRTPLQPGAPTVAAFSARSTRWVRVTISEVQGDGIAAVGFNEIAIGGIDTAETLQLPDDAFRAADRDPSLATAIGSAPLTYQLRRARGTGVQDEELDLRRRFRTIGNRAYDVVGTLQLTGATDDSTVEALVGGAVSASGSDRVGAPGQASGMLAVDGREDSAWVAPPIVGATLTVRFPPQEINHVHVVVARRASAPGVDYSGVSSLSLQAGDGVPQTCAPSGPVDALPTCDIVVSSTVTDHVTMRVAGIDQAPGPFGVLPVAIAEVQPSGVDGVVTASGLAAGSTCRPIATLDDQVVGVHLTGSSADLLAGAPVSVAGCAPLRVGPGWHRLESTPNGRAAIDHLDLSTAGAQPARSATTGSATVVRQAPAGATLHVDAPDGGTLVLGQSFAAGWRANVDGISTAAAPRNAMSSWSVPAGMQGDVVVSYAPQRLYELGLAGLVATASLCLVLLVTGLSMAMKKSPLVAS